MKYLICLFLILSSCSLSQEVKVKEGDCVINNSDDLFKVLQVGNYGVKYIRINDHRELYQLFNEFYGTHRLSDCP